MKLFGIEESEQVCANCRNFYQHFVYSKNDRNYTAVNAGHCCYPRLKNRKPGSEGCEHFESAYEIRTA